MSDWDVASTSPDNLSTFKNFLGSSEGADYNVITGGTTFDDFSKHPGVVGTTTSEGPSTAAGKYQITKSTYDQYAKKLNITDFSPESQDKIAEAIIKDKGAMPDIEKGDYESAINKLGDTWASLPSSKYNQPKRSWDWVKSKLNIGDKPKDDPWAVASTDKVSTDKEDPWGVTSTKQDDPWGVAEEPTNWLGTGPKESVGEYFEKGFAGRIGTGLAERAGLKEKEPKKPEEDKKTPTMGESLKAIGKQVLEYPWETTKSVLYEAGRDPELLYPGLWEAWPAKLGAMVERLNVAGKVAVTAGRAATVGAGLEAGAQAAKDEYDPSAIGTTAVEFGVGGAAGETISQAVGKIREQIKPKPEAEVTLGMPSKGKDVSAVDMMDKMKDPQTEPVKEDIKRQYDMFDQLEKEDHPLKQDAPEALDPHDGKTSIETIRDTIDRIDENAWTAKVWSHEIETTIPEQSVREDMTMSLEGALKYDRLMTDSERAAHIDILEKKYEKLQATLEEDKFLTPEEKQAHIDNMSRLEYGINKEKTRPSQEAAIKFMPKIIERFKQVGEEAKRRGMIEGMRNNYVTHVLDTSKSSLNKEQLSNLMDNLFGAAKEARFNRDFTESRIYDTIRQLEFAIEKWATDHGLKNHNIVVEKDIAKIVKLYDDSMGKAILVHDMIEHFVNTKMEGTKLPAMIEVKFSEDGKVAEVDAKAVKEGYIQFKGVGSKALKDYYIHPDLADPLGFIFRQSDPNLVQRALGGMSHLTKALNTSASLFHFTSLGVAGATAAPKQFVREAFKGFPGIRAAVEHYEKGIGKEQTQLALRSGLKMGSEDVQRTIIADIGLWTDKMLGQMVDKDLKIISYATDAADKQILQRINRWTWDYMHSGQKLYMFNHFLGEMAAKNPNVPIEVLGREVADFVNTTFGGLNWLDVADRVKNKYARAFALKAAGLQGRDWAQILLFAPDWTVSTLRATTNALPKELLKPWKWELRKGAKDFINPKTSADLARRYVFNTMVAWAVLLNAINFAMSGHMIWDNKDPTRVDRGDGTSMQLAKHSMEAAEWLRDPNKTFGNKLGFWPKALVTMLTGKAYPAPNAPMVKKNTTLGRAAHVAETALPFQFSSSMNAPPGERLKRGVFSALGVPIYGQTDPKHTSRAIMRERGKERAARQKEKEMEKRQKALEERKRKKSD